MTSTIINNLSRTSPSEADTLDLLKMGARVAGLGLGRIDYRTDTVVLDDRAAWMFGLPATTDVPRCELHTRIHPEDRKMVMEQIDRMAPTGGPDGVDVVHRITGRPDGEIWVSARKQITFETLEDGSRVPVSGLVALMDITSAKMQEHRRLALMGEMNHRLKNLLTVVQSVARMTARTTTPDAFLNAFSNRMAALGRNQTILMQHRIGSARMADLVQEQLSPFVADTDPRFDCEGPAIDLRESAVQTLGLSLHELGTNAMKYGVLSVPDGRLRIRWQIKDDTFHLDWTETNGPPVSPPTHEGFGSTVLRRMTEATLDAAISADYRPDGLRWSLTCPAHAVVDPQSP